jgi:hypothetical protein
MAPARKTFADDIASLAYWYQREPHAPFPKLPDKDYPEVN